MKKTDLNKLRRRFLNFETLNGVVMMCWGAGFVYCGLYDLRLGYAYALESIGGILLFWGFRKVSVDRIKQKIKIEKLVEQAKAGE